MLTFIKSSLGTRQCSKHFHTRTLGGRRCYCHPHLSADKTEAQLVRVRANSRPWLSGRSPQLVTASYLPCKVKGQEETSANRASLDPLSSFSVIPANRSPFWERVVVLRSVLRITEGQNCKEYEEHVLHPLWETGTLRSRDLHNQPRDPNTSTASQPTVPSHKAVTSLLKHALALPLSHHHSRLSEFYRLSRSSSLCEAFADSSSPTILSPLCLTQQCLHQLTAFHRLSSGVFSTGI